MLTLRKMNTDEIRKLHAIQMHRDFPPSELKGVEAILNLCALDEYDVLAAYEGEVWVGYALVYRPACGDVFLLDYLAIEPQYRGHGKGCMLLKTLKTYYAGRADCLMIECERPKAAPDEAEARRRIRFYQKGGALLTQVRIWLFDVEYSILMMPCNEKEYKDRDWAEQMISLYRRMLPETLFQENVRLIRG